MGEAVPLQSVQVVVPRHGGGVVGGAVGGGRWDVALPIGAEQKREDRSRVSLGRAVEAKARLAQAGRLTRVRERGEGGRGEPKPEGVRGRRSGRAAPPMFSTMR